MNLEIIELFIDELDEELGGVNAISIVGNPAIQENFIHLSSDEIKLAKVDDEKRIVMGAVLVPNKKVFRKGKKEGQKDHFIVFGADTVRRASELFLSKGKQNNTTLEHEIKLSGISVVESWIVEDDKKDKSSLYGLHAPVGSWIVSMKIEDDFLWQEFVKTGVVKGFSIEGKFTDKPQNLSEELDEVDNALKQIEEIVNKNL